MLNCVEKADHYRISHISLYEEEASLDEPLKSDAGQVLRAAADTGLYRRKPSDNYSDNCPADL